MSALRRAAVTAVLFAAELTATATLTYALGRMIGFGT